MSDDPASAVSQMTQDAAPPIIQRLRGNVAHATTRDADCLLVRYLQAEHGPLRLDDAQLLPAGIREGRDGRRERHL